MDDSGAIPYWLAFLVGPVLVAFAAWVLPGRLKGARRRVPLRRVPSAAVNDAFDAWFPAFWAGGVGAFGVAFTVAGLIRLGGIDF